MNSIVTTEKLKPICYTHIIGCGGFGHTKSVICLTANDDNNFLNEGIVEGSLLFVDTEKDYQKGELNVFKYNDDTVPEYKLSRTEVDGATYIGKILMTINRYS